MCSTYAVIAEPGLRESCVTPDPLLPPRAVSSDTEKATVNSEQAPAGVRRRRYGKIYGSPLSHWTRAVLCGLRICSCVHVCHVKPKLTQVLRAWVRKVRWPKAMP